MTDNKIDTLKHRFEGCKWDLEVIKELTPEELKEILDFKEAKYFELKQESVIRYEKDVELAKTKDKINQALKDIRNSTAKLYEPLGELEEYLNEA
tara:strand:+ start:302 stop:586 length:285 start_codon:yes stop_codon:yes gene_type:complete